MLGKVFNNRYRLKEKIGSGGMADVYLADDLLLNREVAVKVLHPQYAADPSFIQRFRYEAQAAANLNHPNIVSIYDWGNEGDIYYIVMEYVEGRDLKQILTTEGRFMPERAAEIAAEICAALQFAHRQNLIHRDIKPHNIIITPMGQVKVMDFGIARVGTGNGMTQTGTVMGTAQYISPEQAQGQAVDARSDIYSLGVVLYELLLGRVPFDDDNAIAVAYKQVKEDPVPISLVDRSMPPALEAIVMKALAKNPENRYSSAQEMKADLLRWLEGMPVNATPVLAAAPVAPTATMAASPPDYPPEPGTRAWVWLTAILAGVLFITGIVLAVVFTSGNGAMVTIPNVANLSENDARQALEAVGLKMRVSDQYAYITSSNDQEGVVKSQDPPSGTKIKKGSTVEVVLTKAFYVPNVTGMKLEDARNVITQNKLSVGTITETASADNQKGMVLSQDPAPESLSHPGAAVNLTVGKGVELVSVPELVGKTQDDAVNALTVAGLKADVKQQSSDTVPSGKVISSDPAANTQVPKGSTVTVNVSSGPAQVTVPDVTGKNEADATSILNAAGFSVVVQKVVDPANNGKVKSQSPPGNTKANSGSTVTIVVGTL